MPAYSFTDPGPRDYNHDYADSYCSGHGFVLCVCDGVGEDPAAGLLAHGLGATIFEQAKNIMEIHPPRRRRSFLQRQIVRILESARNLNHSGQTTITLILGGVRDSHGLTCHILSLGDSRAYYFTTEIESIFTLTSDHSDTDGRLTSYIDAKLGIVGSAKIVTKRLGRNVAAIAALTDGFYEVCSHKEIAHFVHTCLRHSPGTNATLRSWAQEFVGHNAYDNYSVAMAIVDT